MALIDTLQLIALSDQLLPQGMGSGCLVLRNGRKVLLSVSHLYQKVTRWAVHVEFDQGRRAAKNFQLGGLPTFLRRCSLKNGVLEELDFFVAVLPDDFAPKHQVWRAVDVLEQDDAKTCFSGDAITAPTQGASYEFEGVVQGELSPGFGVPNFFTAVESGATLVYEKEEGDSLRFSVKGGHKGHIWYYGCSGAPILSESGELVALVEKGNDSENAIFGVPIAKYLPFIDACIATAAPQG
jgi:hypothetical protein